MVKVAIQLLMISIAIFCYQSAKASDRNGVERHFSVTCRFDQLVKIPSKPHKVYVILKNCGEDSLNEPVVLSGTDSSSLGSGENLIKLASSVSRGDLVNLEVDMKWRMGFYTMKVMRIESGSESSRHY